MSTQDKRYVTMHNSGLSSASSSSSTLERQSSTNDSIANLVSDTSTSGRTRQHANYSSGRTLNLNATSVNRRSLPLGVKFLATITPWTISEPMKRRLHKSLVLIVTFIAYAGFHMGRRPLAVVKDELHHHATNTTTDNNSTSTTSSPLPSQYFLQTSSPNQDWAPFDQDEKHANRLFGYLDTAFLGSYAIGMFFSGMLAERMNLRHFITIGCALSGVGLIIAGLARTLEIHSFSYFIIAQIFSGVMQSTGWPVVVTCVGNWLAKSERGLIYGLWNSHTNLGNIIGAVIAGAVVKQDWGLSFIVPGIIMIIVALIQFSFLVPHPDDVISKSVDEICEDGALRKQSQKVIVSNLVDKEVGKSSNSITSFGSTASIQSSSDGSPSERGFHKTQATSSSESLCLNSTNSKPVSFARALCIPGVIEYSLCLFFSKLVSYTFLYWLPKYLAATRSMDSKQSAFESVWFDIGGAVGAIIAGLASDMLKTNGLICSTMLLGAIPAMFSFQSISVSKSNWLLDASLQALVGALVNGPYCLITTSVSADLGDRIKDGHAMATVAAIIDGMGSLGAVVGPLLAGFITKPNDWWPVFAMLILSNASAAICLSRIVWREMSNICLSPRGTMTVTTS